MLRFKGCAWGPAVLGGGVGAHVCTGEGSVTLKSEADEAPSLSSAETTSWGVWGVHTGQLWVHSCEAKPLPGPAPACDV